MHPQLAHLRKNELFLFDAFLPETRYIGEIGLDGAPEYRCHWNSQVTVFDHVLEKCREAGGRIMSIHSRRAKGTVLDHLDRFPGAGTPVLHWFSGSFKELERAIRFGCWFSVGPAMLKSEKGRARAARVPRERVLTESDGPFAQVNGVAAMPWHVENALHILSEIWALPPDEVVQKLQYNLKALLNKH